MLCVTSVSVAVVGVDWRDHTPRPMTCAVGPWWRALVIGLRLDPTSCSCFDLDRIWDDDAVCLSWRHEREVNTVRASLSTSALFTVHVSPSTTLLPGNHPTPPSIHKPLAADPSTPHHAFLQHNTTAYTPHTTPLSQQTHSNMADVEMTDAGAAPKVKSAKAGASGDAADGKKKFEVKKVCKRGMRRTS